MKIRTITSLSAAIVTAVLLSLSNTATATVVDLTTGLDAHGSINGALFYATDQQPAGTGHIDPFLRVQAHGNSSFEQGYNTDGGFPFDDKHPHNFQHSVELSSLSQFNLDGTAYYKFMLDANQSGNTGHAFSLDRLQLYTSNNGSLTTEAFSTNGNGVRVLDLGHLAYTLNMNDGTSSDYVITTATGSGHFDAIMYVPVANFNQSDRYLYLYFASGDHIASSGGFEEWTAATGAVPIPEAGALFPIVGLLAAIFSTQFLRRRQLARVNKTK